MKSSIQSVAKQAKSRIKSGYWSQVKNEKIAIMQEMLLVQKHLTQQRLWDSSARRKILPIQTAFISATRIVLRFTEKMAVFQMQRWQRQPVN